MAVTLIRLHETTVRGLCRLAFVVLGLAPLGVCAFLAVVALIPGYSRRQARSWEQQLAMVLGVTVKIDTVETMSPYRYRFPNIRFLHPESQRYIGELNQVMLGWDRDRWSLNIDHAIITPDQLWQASRLFHDWHVCRPDRERRRINIELEKLAIDDGQRSFVLSPMRAELMPDTEKWALKATFRSDQSGDSGQENSPSQLLVFRNHQPDSFSTEIQLRAESPIPLWLLATAWEVGEPSSFLQSMAEGLGNSQFTGIADARIKASGPTIYLTNAWIRNIDLGHVGSGTVPLVSGLGQLMLSQAILDSSGLRWAEGVLTSGPGRIDSRFLSSLSKHLGVRLNQQNVTEFQSFDQLSARFRMQPNALQFIGGMNEGAVMLDAHGALASRADPSGIPISELVYALASTPKATPMVRGAILWLPLDEQQRREASQVLRISRN
jgi:hypothetical protein